MNSTSDPSCSASPRRPLSFALLAAIASLAACSPDGSECDTSAAVSVTVQVADIAGDQVEDAAVRYRVDGGEFQDCSLLSNSWTCGVEEAGDFEIEISALGYAGQTQAVTVTQGECHVVGQSLDVVLEEADCNDDAIIPSIILTLLDNGSPLTLEDQAWAQWGRPDVDEAGAACEPGPDDSFICAWEEIGSIEIAAGKIGYYPILQTIEVASDGCHPVTQEVEIDLTTATTPCTEELVGSVALTVTDEGGLPISNAEATYVRTFVPQLTPDPCDSLGDGDYQCGWELAGAVDVSVVADGYQPWSATLAVPSDECHVLTQYAAVVLLIAD